MKGTTIPATSHNLWTGSRAIWLGVIILRHGGTASLRPVFLRTGTAYTSQVLYGPNLLRNKPLLVCSSRTPWKSLGLETIL